jgi:uncharacterized protein YkwD
MIPIRSIRRAIVRASLASLVAATLLTAASPFAAAQPAPAALETEPALEQSLLDLTNRERTARGLPPLIMNQTLREIARIRSYDMANRGYFSHYTVEGLSVFDLLDGFGFRGVQGENIGYNYQDSGTSAPSAIRMFMGSPPHAAQIVSGRYRYIGIGEVTSPKGAKYYTMVFSDSPSAR